jgi:hypothetical protein
MSILVHVAHAMQRPHEVFAIEPFVYIHLETRVCEIAA